MYWFDYSETASVAIPSVMKSPEAAHSLPAAIPHGVEPRTPRTPGGSKNTPRFYPVVKERTSNDPQVDQFIHT